MAAGCRHPLTNLSFLLVLFLLYSVYPIPFITLENFLASEDFLLISLCGGVAVLLTTIFGNIFVLLVFSRLQNTEMYLYLMMAAADMVQPFCYIPIRLTVQWEIYHLSKNEIFHFDHMQLLTRLVKVFFSVRHALAVFSIVSFTVICVLKLCSTLTKGRTEKIPKAFKFVTSAIVTFYSLFLGWLYYVNTNHQWSKVETLAVLSYFIPVTVSSLCLILAFIMQRRMGLDQDANGITAATEVPNNIFLFGLLLSYLVFWMPWFIVGTMTRMEHNWQTRYCIEMLLVLKGCANVFLMIELDSELKIRTILLVKYCCQKQERFTLSMMLSKNNSKEKICKKMSPATATENNGKTKFAMEDESLNTLMNGDSLLNGNYSSHRHNYCTNV